MAFRHQKMAKTGTDALPVRENRPYERGYK